MSIRIKSRSIPHWTESTFPLETKMEAFRVLQENIIQTNRVQKHKHDLSAIIILPIAFITPVKPLILTNFNDKPNWSIKQYVDVVFNALIGPQTKTAYMQAGVDRYIYNMQKLNPDMLQNMLLSKTVINAFKAESIFERDDVTIDYLLKTPNVGLKGISEFLVWSILPVYFLLKSDEFLMHISNKSLYDSSSVIYKSDSILNPITRAFQYRE